MLGLPKLAAKLKGSCWGTNIGGTKEVLTDGGVPGWCASIKDW